MGWKEVGGGLREPGRAGQALSTSRLHLYFSFGFGVFGEGFGI